MPVVSIFFSYKIIYLLVTELEVRTVSYEPSFFPINRHNLQYGLRK